MTIRHKPRNVIFIKTRLNFIILRFIYIYFFFISICNSNVTNTHIALYLFPAI